MSFKMKDDGSGAQAADAMESSKGTSAYIKRLLGLGGGQGNGSEEESMMPAGGRGLGAADASGSSGVKGRSRKERSVSPIPSSSRLFSQTQASKAKVKAQERSQQQLMIPSSVGMKSGNVEAASSQGRGNGKPGVSVSGSMSSRIASAMQIPQKERRMSDANENLAVSKTKSDQHRGSRGSQQEGNSAVAKTKTRAKAGASVSPTASKTKERPGSGEKGSVKGVAAAGVSNSGKRSPAADPKSKRPGAAGGQSGRASPLDKRSAGSGAASRMADRRGSSSPRAQQPGFHHEHDTVLAHDASPHSQELLPQSPAQFLDRFKGSPSDVSFRSSPASRMPSEHGDGSGATGASEWSERVPSLGSRSPFRAAPEQQGQLAESTAAAGGPQIRIAAAIVPDSSKAGIEDADEAASSVQQLQKDGALSKSGSSDKSWSDLQGDGPPLPAPWKLTMSEECSPVSTLDLLLSDDGAGTSDGKSSTDLDEDRSQYGASGKQKSSADSSDPTYSPFPSGMSRGILELLELTDLEFIGEVEGMEQDLEYVRHILIMSGLAGEELPPLFSRDLPISPAVFEQLELGITMAEEVKLDPARRSEERRQRRLLFNAVNEALGRRLAPFLEVPPWTKPSAAVVRSRPTGKALLQEVWSEIHDWPVPSSDEVYDILDDAARRDMSRGTEKWADVSEEVVEVAFDLELLILSKLVEDIASELTAVETQRRKRASSSSASMHGGQLVRTRSGIQSSNSEGGSSKGLRWIGRRGL